MSNGGKGGDAPNGGTGGATAVGAVNGNSGNQPGAGGSGAGAGDGTPGGGGGGSGAYSRRTYGPGELSQGEIIEIIVGLGGASVDAGGRSSGQGAKGKVKITIT